MSSHSGLRVFQLAMKRCCELRVLQFPAVLLILCWLVPVPAAKAYIARVSPDFAIDGLGKSGSLKKLRGRSVVVLVSRSPRDGAFRGQLKRLQPYFREFAARGVIFVAAFTEKDGVIQSDIPFLTANNGGSVAETYGLNPKGFGILVISPEGNLDMISKRVIAAPRIRDALVNSFQAQAATREQGQ